MCGIPMPANEELPVEECSRIIDNMIDNTEIKVILNSECQYILEQKKEKEQLRYKSCKKRVLMQ